MTKEKPATKLCKHCQTEIPYDAKICPNCRKRVKGGKLKWVVLALVLLLVIGALSSGGNDDSSPKKVGNVTSGNTSGEDAQQSASGTGEPSGGTEGEAVQSEYRVGDILMDGDTKIVYMSSGVYTDAEPDEGEQIIYLRFAFENQSDSDDTSISFYSFDCYADGYAADMYYSADDDLSATLSAGRTTTGYVYFEVPESASEVLVEYTPNFLISDQKIAFVYEGEQDSGYVPASNTTPTEGAFLVGDVVRLDDATITYLSCENYESDNMFVQPKDGYHYVSCTFEFENNGDSDLYASSYSFDCYADGVACDQTFIRDDDLSATVSSGHKAQGTVTFEVPDNATVIEAEYETNVWTSERVAFTVQ